MNELEFERRLAHVEDRAKSNTHRLNDLERLLQTVATIAQKQADMDNDVREIKKDVKGLLCLPRKRWDTLIAAALSALATAVMAWLMQGGVSG